MNQCEKDIKLHSYKEKKTEIFMETCSFFEEKNNNLWQSDFHSVCFLAFFSFFFLSVLFSSSFKVNLKVHHRNWRDILLLAPTTTKTNTKKKAPGPEAVRASFSAK